ncbi:hypothetical protein DSM104440_01605 [Usitatibacter palustris]|uniref:Uncharacterized protein n=1 Tax=Usitatibacter palustris TaxID=2732487 RepID=A0A6M4H6I1_9PROT|nr:hypothetical protein DSM104440_01605 [Usitatibacter palustris]
MPRRHLRRLGSLGSSERQPRRPAATPCGKALAVLLRPEYPTVLNGIANLPHGFRVDVGPEQVLIDGGAGYIVGCQLPIQRVGCDEIIGNPARVVQVARPPMLTGMTDHSSTHRIELDVALACEQVALGLDEVGLVASLPQRSGAFMEVIEVAYVTAAQSLHHSRNSACGVAGRQEVEVVGHQDVGMDGDAAIARHLRQATMQKDAVALAHHDRLPVVAANDHMGRNAVDE